MNKTTWRGVTLDQRTADMMDEVAALSGSIYVQPSQGSYSGGVSASAGTHDGGGAIDIMNLTPEEYDRLVPIMRRVGFGAWHRRPDQSNWPHHVHGIAVQPGGKYDQGVLSSGAHSQVIDYYDGLNGLAGRGRDDATRAYVGRTWETYQEEDMALSDKDIDRIANAVWSKKFGEGKDAKNAQWYLHVTHRIARRFLGPGGKEGEAPPAKETLLNKVWQAVKK